MAAGDDDETPFDTLLDQLNNSDVSDLMRQLSDDYSSAESCENLEDLTTNLAAMLVASNKLTVELKQLLLRRR